MAKAKSKFTVYLVMPKVMMHREDGLYQELPRVCWTPFGPLWKSREEAEAFAKQHIEQIQGATYLGVFTTKLADSQFDFDKLPEANQKELQELLNFEAKADWKTSIESYRVFSWELSEHAKTLRRLLELLEIVPYRIVETQVDQRQFEELSEAIAHYNGFQDSDLEEDEEDEEIDDEDSEDIFDEDEEDDEMKYLRPVGLAFGLDRCPEDSIHPEQEFVDNNDGQAGDSGVFW